AKGCEAALKPVTLAVSDTPRRPILLPVPGSSRTSPTKTERSWASEASPGPPLHKHRFALYNPPT
ncbi:hypothetical protein CU665_26785, partial [Pseudomonas syringae pv. actinidifoliorum]|nr:hypothetical protein [Pseudomonas syringae pv. actinidifoliorum]